MLASTPEPLANITNNVPTQANVAKPKLRVSRDVKRMRRVRLAHAEQPDRNWHGRIKEEWMINVDNEMQLNQA